MRLPQLIERLKIGDANTINGVLETLNSIYKRYRSQFMTGKLNEELKYSQQLIVPLWEILKTLSTELQGNSADVTRTRQILSSIRLVCRIFYSLNSPGLTQVAILPPSGSGVASLVHGFLHISNLRIFPFAGNGGYTQRMVCRIPHIFEL